VRFPSQDIRILLTVSNLTHLRETTIPRLMFQFSTAFRADTASDVQMLMDVTDQLDKILFDDYVKRRSAEVAKIIRKGVLGGAVDWYEADKPTGASLCAVSTGSSRPRRGEGEAPPTLD